MPAAPHALVIAALAVQPALVLEPTDAPRVEPVIVHGALLLGTMRTVEAFLWPHPFAETHQYGARWAETFTTAPRFDSSRRAFEWDGDRWHVNAVGHSLLGMELYYRARACGFGWAGSLAWTTGASAMWEYGFEGNAVRASALDLVWTPLAGLLLGEARWALFRAVSRMERGTARDVLRGVIDPLGGIEHALLGNACAF